MLLLYEVFLHVPWSSCCGTEHQQMENLWAEMKDKETVAFMAMHFLKIKATSVSVVRVYFILGSLVFYFWTGNYWLSDLWLESLPCSWYPASAEAPALSWWLGLLTSLSWLLAAVDSLSLGLLPCSLLPLSLWFTVSSSNAVYSLMRHKVKNTHLWLEPCLDHSVSMILVGTGEVILNEA